MMARPNYYFRILTALTLSAAAVLAALLMASAPASAQVASSFVHYTSPWDQQRGLSLDTNVDVAFIDPMKSTTINTDTFTLVKQGTTTPVKATVTYGEGYWIGEGGTPIFYYGATLDPEAALELNTTYTATLKGGDTGVKNIAGTPMSGDDSWSFGTGDTTPPDITITSPKNNTSDSDGSFSVSGSAEAASAVELFEGTTSKGTTKADSSSGAWSIALNGVSVGAHTYSAKAKDAVGNISPASNSVTVTVDKTPPKVSSVSPASGATNVRRNTCFTATFSEKMDPETLTTSTVMLVKYGTTTPISGTMDLDGSNQTIRSCPWSLNLDARTKYTVKIKGGTNGVKDLAGNQLGGGNQASGDYWWSFTTGSR